MKASKKTMDLDGYGGLTYVKVRGVPMVQTSLGDGVHSGTLKKIEYKIAKFILTEGIPLCGREVRFIRKAAGFTLVQFAELFGLTAPCVLKWEKMEDKRLDPINEFAVRSRMAESFNLKVMVQFSELEGMKRPKRPIILKAS